MKMIGHQAIRMHLPAGLQTDLLERTQKPASILFILEDRFAAMPAIHPMINRADVLDSQLPGHTAESARPSENCQLSGPLSFPSFTFLLVSFSRLVTCEPCRIPRLRQSLNDYTLAVRQRVCRDKPYAIGLRRLSDQASRELADRSTLLAFQKWLNQHNCYLFTINGFPYGRFHGARVKEQVYAPDWTVPCSFKPFITTPEQVRAMRDNLWRCVEHTTRLSERSGNCTQKGSKKGRTCEPCRILRLQQKYGNTIDRHLFLFTFSVMLPCRGD
jgi:hypothetical protein